MSITFCKPIAAKFIIRASRNLSIAHRIYPHSVDFFVPVGTPVRAAASGVVVDVIVRFNHRGPERRFERYENFIEIRHADNTYSYYGHLKRNGSAVRLGQRVRTGQLIGYSGNTGWMANVPEPHLHFMVGRYDYRTIRFSLKKSR